MPDTETPLVLNTGGPFTPEYTKQVAGALAEGVRVLNHGTGNHTAEALRWPADVDAIVQSLTTMTERSPQLLEQIGDWLEEECAEGRLLISHGPWKGNPDETVTQVQSWLSGATEAAGELYAALNGARQVTATIGAPYDPAEDPDA